MRQLLIGTALLSLFFIGHIAEAQQIDAAFALNTITAPSASSASGKYSPQSLSGGTYLSAGADFLFKKNFGVNAEVAWRARQTLYQGFQPFRPIFYDFNAVYAPRLGKALATELMGGIGVESIHFYQPFLTCNFVSCSNFVSSNHFLGHVGAALRVFVFGNVFIRPEAHAYFIRNNFEFSSARAERFGVSIGYSFASQY